MMILRLFFCFLLLVKVTEVQASKDECKPHAIRFPFRLKGKPDRRGFELSCTKNKQMVLELPQQVKLVVKSIDYKTQTIWVSVPHDCLQLQHLDLSASPFHYINNSLDHYVFFNCSREANSSIYQTSHEIPCLSGPGFQVVAFPIHEDYDYYNYKDIPLLYCTRTFINFQDTRLPNDIVDYKKKNVIRLVWYQPDCKQCEAVGQNCKLSKNSSQDTTECSGWTKKQRDSLKILLAAGIILGSPFVGLVLLKFYRVQRSYRAEKEGQLKIEKFLQDYKALKPSRYSYADIKRITNQFKDKLGEGGFGTVFKGRLSNDVLVAVKVLNNFIATGEEFINEVGSMCRIHHVNVTRLIGFCADGNKRALVYEFMHNESLDKFIFGGTIDEENRFLGWEKLEFIATGIAKGIEYLHHGCDQQILHFDIKPHNILLDHNFNPKISDFGLAKLCSKEQSAVSMTTARGTMGYIAPEVLSRNFGKASHKSDVYSFGMLLLEMVGGRKNIDATVENTSQVYFPEWVYNRLNRGEEVGIREENDEVHSKIARKLTIVGLWCIQWYPTDRPSMKDVIHMLEEVESLTMPPNPFAHTGGLKARTNQLINRELPVIDELE